MCMINECKLSDNAGLVRQGKCQLSQSRQALQSHTHSAHSLSRVLITVTCSSSPQPSAPVLKCTPLTHRLALKMETDSLPALLTLVVRLVSLFYLLC